MKNSLYDRISHAIAEFMAGLDTQEVPKYVRVSPSTLRSLYLSYSPDKSMPELMKMESSESYTFTTDEFLGTDITFFFGTCPDNFRPSNCLDFDAYYGDAAEAETCSHEWVDVGFTFSTWVCKHCDVFKPADIHEGEC